MPDDILINRLTHDELDLGLYNLVSDVRGRYRSSGGQINGTIYVSIEESEPHICGMRGAVIKKGVSSEVIIQRCLFGNIDYRQSPSEFEFLIAHEFSHIYNDDYFYMKISWILGFISPLIVYGILINTLKDYVVSYFLTFLFIIFELRVYTHWRRKMETRCDKEAFTIMDNAIAAINAFKKRDEFIKEVRTRIKGVNKLKLCLLLGFYFISGNSHPDYPKRIENIEKWARELPK
jgi:hypothetical protein